MTVASIDIGTNTILLLIAEVNAESNGIKVIENFHSIPRIGKGMKPGMSMPEENIKRLLDVLTEYSSIIKNYNCEKVILTGTNALRISSNKNEIAERIKKQFDYDLTIIPGEEEAKFSYLGAIGNYLKDQKYLVIDIGGGSTEIVYGSGNEIIFSKSFNIGVVSASENFLFSDPPTNDQVVNFINYSEQTFSEITKSISDIDSAIAIAGTPTTLACIKNNLKTYNEDVVEGSYLTSKELEKFIKELSHLNSGEILNKYAAVVKGREDVLLAGTIILKEILDVLNLNEIKVSTKGIRYGAIINWLNTLHN
ncbi:MAG TPA: Ppx/GppA phosphatase family protein [Ignavibacteriaceae bacterium]|nr:Ppx/GppA phosphatase family protein [Ignavibacteriaceae bacterium]